MSSIMLPLVVLSLLLPCASPSTPLSSLLSQQVSAATCRARCGGSLLEAEEELEECLQLCLQSLQAQEAKGESSLGAPISPICKLQHLCPKCRVACGEGDSEEERKFSSFQRTEDELAWSVDLNEDNTLFLVAGKDAGGMWHLVREQRETVVSLSDVDRYSSVTILAVGWSGLMDSLHITMPPRRQGSQSSTESSEEIKSFFTSTVIIIAVLSSVSFFLLLPLLYKASAALSSVLGRDSILHKC